MVRYPVALVIGGVIIIATIIAIIFARRNIFDTPKKDVINVANTEYVKRTPEYIKYAKVRQITIICSIALLLILSALCFFSAARPSSSQVVDESAAKKDIMLCLDASSSVAETNVEIVESMKDIVDGLNGEKIGITVFNTNGILYVPLTDDYEYVQARLSKLREFFALMAGTSYGYSIIYDEEIISLSNEITYNYETRGSSLIGDGLATAVYAFPGVDDGSYGERTRIIIMSTDNCNAAKEDSEIISIEKASQLAADNGITIYGLFPSKDNYYLLSIGDYQQNYDEFSKCVEKTNGQTYIVNNSDAVQSIIDQIDAIEVQGDANSFDTIIMFTDHMEIPAILLLLLLCCAAAIRGVARR